MHHLQSDWPRLSLPKSSHNSIYVINIVKFSNSDSKSIQLSPANFYGFLFSVGKPFLSCHFTIEKGEIFENRFSIMFFKMFCKLTTVKILVYTVKVSCVTFAFRLNWAKFIIKMKDLFFQLQECNS